MRLSSVAASLASLAGMALGQDAAPATPFPTSCQGVGAERFGGTVAAGWQATKIGGGMQQPRALVFDTLGQLLVLQAQYGISGHTFGDDGCINSTTTIQQNIRFNHGLSLSPDGTKLYASSQSNVWEWDYDAATMAISNERTVVSGISTGIHSTRTVHVVPQQPNLIIVSVGSNSNLDMNAGNMRATVRVFDVETAPANGWDYNTEGHQFGWGLRNSVALAFDPNGEVWAAENSADDFRRDGQDIHIDNPAEELNYLGDPTTPNEAWYGYPQCFTIWDSTVVQGLSTGDQFVQQAGDYDDARCASESIPPRLSFQAHSAPIDAAFDAAGENLYITFHGSWNRQPATGYAVVEVPFTTLASGGFDPVAAADSTDGYSTIFSASDPSGCQSQSLTMSSCFRLAGLTWDPSGTKLFVSSDNQQEGEMWVLQKTGA